MEISPERTKQHKWIWVPLILILLLNLFWAFSLELYADEAYYFLYSKRLDWGYFDHPPMVGFLVWIGNLLIPGEMGVRFLFILLSTASYGLLYHLVKPKNPFFFWLVVFGLFPLQLLGFLALPDMPLFFFCILFFIQYRRFIQQPNVINSIVLSVVIAAMLYSKYHGILVVFFTLLAYPQVVKNREFYLVLIAALILYAPHIYWLVQHDFVTISYHLYERESSGFALTNLINYVLAFLLFNGPLLFVPLLIGSFRGDPFEPYERALFFNLMGFMLFFFFMAFRGRVEANWLFPVLIPAMILGYRYLPETRYFRVLAGFSVLIVVTVKFLLLFPFSDGNRLYEFHGHKAFAREVKKQSGGMPIVANRYQEASLLSYYLDEFVPAMNIKSRRNQFDLWEDQQSFKNRSVMFLHRDPAGTLVHPYFGTYTLEERIIN